MEVRRGVEEANGSSGELTALTEGPIRELPPILTSSMPGRIEERVEQFFLSVAQILEKPGLPA